MLSNGALLLFYLLPLSAAGSPPSPLSPAAACRSSFYPKFCHALLSPLRLPSNPYDYGRYSVKQALKHARRTSSLLDRYLAGAAAGDRARRGVWDGGALEDCRELASLNADYLRAVRRELGQRGSALGLAGAARVRALMSAVVTNQQTCYDGLEASRSFPELRGALDEANRLYGVSLGLVSSALYRNAARGHSVDADSPIAVGRNLFEGRDDVVPINQSVTVAKDGSQNFTSVADAVAFAPNDTAVEDGYFAIFISEGVYNENVVVPKNKKNLILIGACINCTVITSNRSVMDGWTTFASATFAVHGERFIAEGITFENTAGPAKHQAVAVRNSADLSAFYRCSFLGHQDTLYVHSLRQFYRDCDVYGTVDFIFGNAAAVFQNCNLYPRRPLPGQANAVTAQGRTTPDQATGISIHNCTIRAAPDIEPGGNGTRTGARTFLGRPWKEFSRTVYMQSYIGGEVEAVGWMEWNGSFALSTLYYGEYENYGPGADTSGRVRWPGFSLMNASDAFNFTVSNFTAAEAWLSSTSVPFNGGLL